MRIGELIKKSRASEVLSREELVYLLSHEPDSAETYMVMAEATRISKELSGGKAEVHAQFAINLAPCPGDCLFCSFANKASIPDSVMPSMSSAFALIRDPRSLSIVKKFPGFRSSQVRSLSCKSCSV